MIYNKNLVTNAIVSAVHNLQIYCCFTIEGQEISWEDAEAKLVGIVTSYELAEQWKQKNPELNHYSILFLNDSNFIDKLNA